MERPELIGLSAEIVAYIEHLEGQLLSRPTSSRAAVLPAEPSEPPTTMQVVTMTRAGVAKRTSRHLYYRQRRSGMGVFDLDANEDDPPAFLAVADESASLLVWTNRGRVYKLPVANIPQTEVRGRGGDIADQLKMMMNEQIVALLRESDGDEVALVSERGWARTIRASFMGSSLLQGMGFHDPKEGGDLVAACWIKHDDDLLLVSEKALGIRFSARQLGGRRGRLGMRVSPGDRIMAVTATQDDGAVLLLGADGKGTLRAMSGFRQNKAPGAGGKVTLKTEKLVGVLSAAANDDVFAISALGKMIRFGADEIPPKAGVVQGVNIMALRNDEVTAVTTSPRPADA